MGNPKYHSGFYGHYSGLVGGISIPAATRLVSSMKINSTPDLITEFWHGAKRASLNFPARQISTFAIVAFLFSGNAPRAEMIELKVVDKKPISQRKVVGEKSGMRLGSGVELSSPAAPVKPDNISTSDRQSIAVQQPKATKSEKNAKSTAKKETPDTQFTEKSVKTLPLKRNLSLTECSRAFHSAMGNIRTNEWEVLNRAYRQARAPDKSLPGKLLFKVSATNGTLNLKAIKRARKIARSRGKANWISGDGAGWLTHRMVSDLKTYLSQPFKPYICTGSTAFVKFISPHAKKIAKFEGPTPDYWSRFLPVTNEALIAAWYSITNIATPVWATNRPIPKLFEDAPIRPTIEPQSEDHTSNSSKYEVSENEKTGSISARNVIIDADLPLLKNRRIDFTVTSNEDIPRAIEALLLRAVSSGYLIGKNNVKPRTTVTGTAKSEIGRASCRERV